MGKCYQHGCPEATHDSNRLDENTDENVNEALVLEVEKRPQHELSS